MQQPRKKLIVWQKAADLSVTVYDTTENFPKHELYGITSQIRRTAVSIAANLAEGSARRGPKEPQQFLNVAKGSLSELDTHLEIAMRVNLLSDPQLRSLQKQLHDVECLLYGYLKSVESRGTNR